MFLKSFIKNEIDQSCYKYSHSYDFSSRQLFSYSEAYKTGISQNPMMMISNWIVGNRLDLSNHSDQNLKDYLENFTFNNQSFFNHSQYVSHLCLKVGKALKFDARELEKLKWAALYHDIGKSRISKEILEKTGPLNIEEWKIMKKHPIYSYDILNKHPKYKDIAIYTKYHHERIDGSGYPEGLKGFEIPLISRIISVVDAYEAMTSDRPYKKAISKESAIKELVKHSHSQFDSSIVKIFISILLNE